jgi:hypothetical protein
MIDLEQATFLWISGERRGTCTVSVGKPNDERFEARGLPIFRMFRNVAKCPDLSLQKKMFGFVPPPVRPPPRKEIDRFSRSILKYPL